MYIPYTHDRVVRKSTGAVCLVVFVNIHNRTVDLFAPRGAGDLIEGVPFAEVARVNQASRARPTNVMRVRDLAHAARSGRRTRRAGDEIT
jgi:hypothetical protein